MQMKTGVEQYICLCDPLMLNMLPDRAVLPGDAISQQLGTSPTYFQKLLRKLVSARLDYFCVRCKRWVQIKEKSPKRSGYTIFIQQ